NWKNLTETTSYKASLCDFALPDSAPPNASSADILPHVHPPHLFEPDLEQLPIPFLAPNEKYPQTSPIAYEPPLPEASFSDSHQGACTYKRAPSNNVLSTAWYELLSSAPPNK